MDIKGKHLVKLVMKSGQAFGAYCEDGVVDELVAHPKFLKMQDEGNDIFVSLEDVSAFEIVSNRKEKEVNEVQPEEKSAQQA